MIVLIRKMYCQTYRHCQCKTPYTITGIDTDDHQALTKAKNKTVQFQH